jgi:hypothetical protein
MLTTLVGSAIAQAASRRFPGDPGSSPGQVMWDLWWTKWHSGRFSPSTSVSPANSHSTGVGTIGQLMADVPSGLSLTQTQETKKKN